MGVRSASLSSNDNGMKVFFMVVAVAVSVAVDRTLTAFADVLPVD